ncbi:hypothetical protein GCM10007881_30950 [Mesorhizobium huakuii]|nr:hypothetical protein GCM10007881_30950 [Mesorhizobium huakuii]
MLHERLHFRFARSVNIQWHGANPAPREPNSNDSLSWHLRHAVHCNCYPLPREVTRELERRQIFAYVSDTG